jgi:predicted nucleotidyltransferase
MRLSLFDIENILKVKDSTFGLNAKIYLFGSRLDDSLKGGDIDLFVDYGDADKFERKLSFLTQLQEVLGEQKIDVILPFQYDRLIESEARKGIELDLSKIKISRYLNQCDKHLQRMEEAYGDISPFLPLTVEQFKNLNKDQVQDVDQYLFRFAKLQDTMGDKLFRLIVKQFDPDGDSVPFVDMLNKLEKIGYLVSAKEWMTLRKIRNEISHQYDDEPEEMTLAINTILNHKKVIKEIYLKLKNKVRTLIAD